MPSVPSWEMDSKKIPSSCSPRLTPFNLILSKEKLLNFLKVEMLFLLLISAREEFISQVPIFSICPLTHQSIGAVAGELASEYGEMYETKTKHKVSCLRQHIIDAIVGCPDVPLPAAFWTKSEPAPAPAHTEKAPEKTSKPEPAAKPEKPEPGSLNSTPSRNSLTPNKKEATKREKSTDKGSDKK